MERYVTNIMVIFFILHSLELINANDGKKHCPAKVRSSRHHVETHNKTCYMFVNIEHYWDEARLYCWHMGGEMLYVQNQDTMDFIKRVLNSRELNWSNNGVWNGASDLRNNGWEWTTGQRLTYKYWAPDEPSSFLGFLSLENCCCMRRSDSWKWHDYHCHMDGYEYDFICQFPMVHQQTYTDTQLRSGATTVVDRDDRVAVISLFIAGIALLITVGCAIYFLYRKHEHQKREHQKRNQRIAIRFQNTGYATIIQNVSHDRSHDGSSEGENRSAARPISNIYLEPAEVTRIYDEVNKDSNITGAHNSVSPNNSETAHLLCSGGASSAGNLFAGAEFMSSTPSEDSGTTSGYCSSSTARKIGGEGDYVEMSGGNSMAHLDGLGGEATVVRSAGSSIDDLKNCKGGATGSVHALKSSNMYVTPIHYDSALNNNSPHTNEKAKSPEIHIYSNRLDEMDNDTSIGLRPLPPVPNKDNSIHTDKSLS